jgi:TonB family protein
MKKTLLALLIPAIGFSSDWIAALDQARGAMSHGELVNAEQILNSAIDQAQAQYGHNSPSLDLPLEMLAQVYQREKRYADAVATQQWRLDIWTGVAGENGVVVARVLQQRSVAERQAGNLLGAESDSRRALAIVTAAFVDKPPAAQAAADLADVLLAEHRTGEAEQMLALAQKTFETSLGSASMLATGVAARRAAVLKQLGRVSEAAVPAAAVYKSGGDVSAPRMTSHVGPEYSEEARANKLQGSIQVSLVVDVTGAPTQIAILHPLGMGLDEKAIEAISQWKFTPGQKNGSPVPVFTQVEVTFHLL